MNRPNTTLNYRPDDPICAKPWSIEQPNRRCKLPWMEHHPDGEISTALLASMSKFFPAHYMATDAGSRALAEALIEIQELLPTETLPGDWMMGAKVRKTKSWPRSWANFSLL